MQVGERVSGGDGHAAGVVQLEEAFELVDVGQPPVTGGAAVRQAVGSARQSIADLQPLRPCHHAEAVGILQPDEAGELIGHRAVAVVGEARGRAGQTRPDFPVLPGAGAADQCAARRPAPRLPGLEDARRHGRSFLSLRHDLFSCDHRAGRQLRTGQTKNGCSLFSKIAGPTPRMMNIAWVGAAATEVEVQ